MKSISSLASQFRRKLKVSSSSAPRPLPLHFFTIVLNGDPFIRYHEQVFAQLQIPWHWHVIEGVAALSHDTAWSAAAGGHVAAEHHSRGRSNDGTSDYLDDLLRRMPERVTLYRKPQDEFWDGKREMCNAPLVNIKEDCLLWQVDADEFWTAAQIAAVYRLFEENPSKTAAYFWCHYFVGPEKIISTRYNYAENPAQEWRRLWRFRPGDRWLSHEPPTLMRPKSGLVRRLSELLGRTPFGKKKPCGTYANWFDYAGQNPLTQNEAESIGAVFQHFAYATEAQLKFKESYYGYAGALEKWRALQRHRGSGFLRDYFSWVTDTCMFDDARMLAIAPLAFVNNGLWTFGEEDKPAGEEDKPADRRAESDRLRPRIIVDGYFFQIANSGIARVWLNLFRIWSENGFANQIFVLDRAGSAPRIEGLHYIPVEALDYKHVGADAIRLESVCHRLDADLCVSTYYTTPLTTPSVFMGYDMIPEVFGLDPDEPRWREKRRAIEHASAHIMISKNSARDLEHFMPCVAPDSTVVAYCGVDPAFKPVSQGAIDSFRQRYGLTKPYLLLVGDRSGAGGYKNGVLAFKAFAELPDPDQYILVCTGGWEALERDMLKLCRHRDVRKLRFSDGDLVAAYAGAHALIYPSRYEGFGLPVVEAMACGCPVITCRNSSLIEVAGESAFFVGEDEPMELVARIRDLESDDVRQSLIQRGYKQAAKFDFKSMADTIEATLRRAHKELRGGRLAGPGEGWRELREAEYRAETNSKH
jgi:glycosyltransferase involved in cell wall biosynthesis